MKSEEWEIVSGDYTDRVDEWAQELEVEFPFYMQAYTEALSVILKNISYNREIYQNKQKRCSVFISTGNEYADLQSNIFALMGERGSGKTTALYEFCKILCNYRDKACKWDEEAGFKGKGSSSQCCFYVMEPIDASVLGNKEDLLEVILAGMYQVFQKKVRDNRSAGAIMGSFAEGLTRSFDDVYKSYINMGNLKEQKVNGDAVLAKLNNTSNSLKTKAALEKLVELFLELLNARKNEESYLVIAVDDLDLNLKNGYEMLEQLQKFLANPRVIILVAVRYEQMKMICEKHIVDSLVPEYGGVHKNVYERFDEKARRISNDYLLKVLPLTNRIYMPQRSAIYKKAFILQKADMRTYKKEDKKTVKEFILKKIAGQMGIYYDAKGVKKHFCLPDTIRELSTYNDFLDSLFSILEIEAQNRNEKKKWMLLYDQNHDRFNRDIENRMAVQVLTDDQIDLYRQIMARDIKRRAQYAVEFLKLRMERNKRGMSGRRGHLRDIADNQDYSYADLLEVLYKLGREDYDDKPLVHCLLASFTSEMVREYYCYRYGEEGQRDSGERLKEFLGKTFGGDWFGRVLRGMKIRSKKKEPAAAAQSGASENLAQDLDEERPVGYIPGAKLKEVLVTIKTEALLKGDGKERALIDELAGYLPYIECLILCFSNFRDISGRPLRDMWTFESKLDNTEKGMMFELTVKNNAESADFDILGFIGKELLWTDEKIRAVCKEYADSLSKCLQEYFSANKNALKADEDVFNTVYNAVQNKSIWYQGDRNPQEEKAEGTPGADKPRCRAVFPYYNLDMSYNIMKRARINIVKNTGLAGMHICPYFRTVYGYIAEELHAEQEYYSRTGEGGGADSRFYTDFIESPFVHAFGIISGDEKVAYNGTLDEKRLDTIFYDAITGLYTKQDLDPAIVVQVVGEE